MLRRFVRGASRPQDRVPTLFVQPNFRAIERSPTRGPFLAFDEERIHENPHTHCPLSRALPADHLLDQFSADSSGVFDIGIQ